MHCLSVEEGVCLKSVPQTKAQTQKMVINPGILCTLSLPKIILSSKNGLIFVTEGFHQILFVFPTLSIQNLELHTLLFLIFLSFLLCASWKHIHLKLVNALNQTHTIYCISKKCVKILINMREISHWNMTRFKLNRSLNFVQRRSMAMLIIGKAR